MNGLKAFLLSFVLLFVLGVIVLAQEEVTTPKATEKVEKAVVEAVNLDEDIQPEDLEVSEPKLLPDSPFYFLKNWSRGIQSFLTFNPVRRAELRMKFANEKLMEVKKLVALKKDPEIIKKATENYQQEVEKIKNQAEKIKDKARENPQVESFLDKFIHQQTLHQKLLDRLETQVPTEAFEKIKDARERHLERFKDVMLKLEDRKEKIGEKLEQILEKQKGSEFKEFKNLEILKRVEEIAPEEVKEAIKKAQENTLRRLETKLEKMSAEKQEQLKGYLEKISGEAETPKFFQCQTDKDCEKVPIMAPIKFRCVEGRCRPAGPIGIEEGGRFCVALWDPVCGKDGKTYSNECFAKLAGVEIDYKGVCKEVVPVQPLPPEKLPTLPE